MNTLDTTNVPSRGVFGVLFEGVGVPLIAVCLTIGVVMVTSQVKHKEDYAAYSAMRNAYLTDSAHDYVRMVAELPTDNQKIVFEGYKKCLDLDIAADTLALKAKDFVCGPAAEANVVKEAPEDLAGFRRARDLYLKLYPITAAKYPDLMLARLKAMGR